MGCEGEGPTAFCTVCTQRDLRPVPIAFRCYRVVAEAEKDWLALAVPLTQ